MRSILVLQIDNFFKTDEVKLNYGITNISDEQAEKEAWRTKEGEYTSLELDRSFFTPDGKQWKVEKIFDYLIGTNEEKDAELKAYFEERWKPMFDAYQKSKEKRESKQ